MKCTKFYDMHSGGGRKLQWENILIEAPYDEAVAFFQNFFDRDPSYVTCDCCGEDYSISEYESLEEAMVMAFVTERDKESLRIITQKEILTLEQEKVNSRL